MREFTDMTTVNAPAKLDILSTSYQFTKLEKRRDAFRPPWVLVDHIKSKFSTE